PAAPDAVSGLLGQLDTVDAMLAAASDVDDAGRKRIAMRLNGLLATFGGLFGQRQGTSLSDRIESATDDELFGLLTEKFAEGTDTDE
ncbi:MAG: hypothetical protein ACRDN0_12430, partial [Trebonia sp.]